MAGERILIVDDNAINLKLVAYLMKANGYTVDTALDVAVSATGTTGADRDALALLATFAWRPLP